MNELKLTFNELRKALTDIQIQIDWIDSTIDDLEKIYNKKSEQ